MNFLSHIRTLEKLKNSQREQYIKDYLQKFGVPFRVQKVKQLFWSGENVIIDYPFHVNLHSDKKKVLISAHSNKFLNSPGANDNASGVSVLLELIRELQQSKSDSLPLRFVFFAYEDGCYPSRIGSRHYIQTFGYRDLAFVLNVDSVGMGDVVSLEGMKRDSQNVYFQKLQTALSQANIHTRFYEKPFYGIFRWNIKIFVGDHTSFLLAGFSDACTFIMDHQRDLWYSDLIAQEKWRRVLWAGIKYCLNKKNSWPYKLKHYHNQFDTSEFIEPGTLERVYRVIWNFVTRV